MSAVAAGRQGRCCGIPRFRALGTEVPLCRAVGLEYGFRVSDFRALGLRVQALCLQGNSGGFRL